MVASSQITLIVLPRTILSSKKTKTSLGACASSSRGVSKPHLHIHQTGGSLATSSIARSPSSRSIASDRSDVSIMAAAPGARSRPSVIVAKRPDIGEACQYYKRPVGC